MFLTALAFAQGDAPTAAPAGGMPPSNLLVWYAIFIGAIVFLFILPQRRKQKEHEKKIASIKEKDRVITSGGILGTIMRVKGNIVELKVAENVKIDVLKSSISSIIEDES